MVRATLDCESVRHLERKSRHSMHEDFHRGALILFLGLRVLDRKIEAKL